MKRPLAGPISRQPLRAVHLRVNALNETQAATPIRVKWILCSFQQKTSALRSGASAGLVGNLTGGQGSTIELLYVGADTFLTPLTYIGSLGGA